MQIFIGSSSEGLVYAADVWTALDELGSDLNVALEANIWTDDGLFLPGDTIIESLEKIGESFAAGIFIATEDDQTVKGGQPDWTPRDNIVFEAGYFGGKWGRRNAVLLKIGNARLPSDLEGVLSHRLAKPTAKRQSSEYDRNAFVRRLKKKLRPWVESLAQNGLRSGPDEAFPRTLETLRRLATSGVRPNDEDTAALLEKAMSALEESPIVDAAVMVAKRQLPDCYSVQALDVLGPQAWASPTAFRYLAAQLRYYARANVLGRQWDLQVGKELGTAIARVIDSAKKKGLTESCTQFDNPKDFSWASVDERPRMEYARILLWSCEELKHPIATAVIDIHMAFHVPLFFLETPKQSPAREFDFICFHCARLEQGAEVLESGGCVNSRDRRGAFELSFFDNGIVRSRGRASKLFSAQLNRAELLFAADARELST